MAYPADFLEKKLASYDYIFNAVASEGDAVPSHDLRLSTMKALVHGGSAWDAFITRDFRAQGYDDSTAVADYQSRMSGLLSNIVAEGG
jgi:hypothetical protein